MDESDQLVQFRVDSTGRVEYERRISMPGINLQAVRERVQGRLAGARDLLRAARRRAVTGNAETRVRDYMAQVPQVKLVDKLSFTLGVLCIVTTEFLALRQPQYFSQFYSVLITALLVNRIFEYTASGEQLFMIDFCYFMNFSVLFQTFLYPDNLAWFQANYVLCMGVLMLAVVVWQNSLVFHSLDKLTSCAIHIFPPLTCHLVRWGMIPSGLEPDSVVLGWDDLALPGLLYSAWQLLYLLLTELILPASLPSYPGLVTSLRYLARDNKNGMHQLTKRLSRKIGLMGPTEEFQSETVKTKAIFLTMQALYTLVTSLPALVLYSSYSLSVVYMSCILTWCVWRGGSYYIEVFSERYKLKFVRQECEASAASSDGELSDHQHVE